MRGSETRHETRKTRRHELTWRHARYHVVARSLARFPRLSPQLSSTPLTHAPQDAMAGTTPTNYVTLVSSDGYEFKLLRSAACISGTIKKALDPTSGFRETNENRVDLPTIKYVCAAPAPTTTPTP